MTRNTLMSNWNWLLFKKGFITFATEAKGKEYNEELSYFVFGVILVIIGLGLGFLSFDYLFSA